MQGTSRMKRRKWSGFFEISFYEIRIGILGGIVSNYKTSLPPDAGSSQIYSDNLIVVRLASLRNPGISYFFFRSLSIFGDVCTYLSLS